jgi:hypothetical protein
MKKNASTKNRVLTNKTIPALTIGIDIGDKEHAICVLDIYVEILNQRTITNHRDSYGGFR